MTRADRIPKHCRKCPIACGLPPEKVAHCPGAPERKQELRRAISASLSSMTPEVRRSKSRLIARHVEELGLFRHAETVMAYVAMEMEVDPWSLIVEAWSLGKRVAMPRIDPPLDEPQIPRVHDRYILPFELHAAMVDDPGDHPGLRMDVFGIWEPNTDAPVVDAAALDVILVPCLAYDRRGYRMGKGGGFYDRFLSRDGLRATSVGLAFSEQVFDRLPNCPHDMPVDLLVTESGVTDFREQHSAR